jgi:hypothetical protein
MISKQFTYDLHVYQVFFSAEMSVCCGLTGEIVTDRARISIMQTQRIRWVDHFSWPWMVAIGNEQQAEDLVPRNMMAALDADDAIYIPRLHGVYVFQTVDGEHIVWYAQANMVAFGGKLYHVVFQEGNLLAAYAWLVQKKVKDARFVLVMDTDLRWQFRNGKVLRIRGSAVNRDSGEFKDTGTAYVNCIQMVPPVQWWQAPATYFDDLWREYAAHDRITCRLLKLQNAVKKWSHKKKAERLDCFRNIGWFSVLNDDLFKKITDMAFKSASHHCVQIELGLGSRRPCPRFQIHLI